MLKWHQSEAMRRTYEKRLARGDEPPPPAVRADLQGYWAAWQRLRNDRQHAGMGGTPLGIPFTALDRYAERYGYRGATAFDDLVELVSALDDAYLTWWAEKNKPKEGGA